MLHAGPLVGFYVACHRCGSVVVVLKDDQREMTEGDAGVSFSPGVTCRTCRCVVIVRDGEFVDV